MIDNKEEEILEVQKNRFSFFIATMVVLFSIIVIKLLYIQVIKEDYYKDKANVDSTRFIAEKAPRGKIIDSTGTSLATNTETYNVTYTSTPESEKDFYTTMGTLNKILNENNEKIFSESLLQVNNEGNLFFDYKTDIQKERDNVEVRFKTDIGITDKIEKNIFKETKKDLTDEENNKLRQAVLEVTPEETFNYMIRKYKIYDILNLDDKDKKELKELEDKAIAEKVLEKYSKEEIMPYILIKNSISMQGFKGYTSIVIAKDIKEETYLTLTQMLNTLSGINVNVSPVRNYPYGEFGASFMGYISKIGAGNSEVYKLKGYDVSSDLVGASGIEAAFEDQLKGTKGGLTVKVDSKGKISEELFRLESSAGNDIHLTIDKDVQYAAEQSLKDILNQVNTMVDFNGATYPSATRGATVALEVDTGRVLALASYPSYDPNMFAKTGGLSEEESKKYFTPDYKSFYEDYVRRTGATLSYEEMFETDDNGYVRDIHDIYPRNFFNYATQGIIPPGSSFKPLTAIAGLQEGVIDENTWLYDKGVWDIHKDELQNYAPTNYGKLPNGKVDIKRALQVSSNFYFYETGYRMYKKNGSNPEALNTIAKYAWQFGLGTPPGSNIPQTTGIEIEEEFGQVYTFERFRNNVSFYGLMDLASILNSGTYQEVYEFIPLDINRSDKDSDNLEKAKKTLKEKIENRLDQIGTGTGILTVDEFKSSIKDDVRNVMKNSEQYQEASKGVDEDKQVAIVSEVISVFVLNEKASQATTPVELINASIGQGSTLVTPLQLAGYMATLANGGTRYKLSLVDKITAPDGQVIQEFTPEVLGTVDMSPENLQLVKEGMYRVNHADPSNYVVKQFGNFPIKTAGKTGTADFKNTEEDYKTIGRQPYATYGSFAPYDDPKIAVYTVLYDGGRGSYSAFPSKAIFEAYFKDELLEMDPNYANKSESFRKYVVDSPFNKEN